MNTENTIDTIAVGECLRVDCPQCAALDALQEAYEELAKVGTLEEVVEWAWQKTETFEMIVLAATAQSVEEPGIRCAAGLHLVDVTPNSSVPTAQLPAVKRPNSSTE